MRRNTLFITMIGLLTCGGNALAQDYFDDVYYNPKKDITPKSVSKTAQKEKQSYYIADMGEMDVDAYNRRGEQYYVSEIDTIGTAVENGDDFIYTQQIQKFYNPTIVVDNAKVLDNVLSNAIGNVEIVINDYGNPVFAPYSYGWNWPYYTYAYSPWSWGVNIGPWGWSIGWGPSWNWGPGWNWGWGPSWSWGPAWNWGWGPSWSPLPPAWRPHPGPGWRPGPMATWSPGGIRPSAPRPGWISPSRPGVSSRVPVSSRPSSNHRMPAGVASRPSGVVNNNGRWEYNTNPGNNTAHRTPGVSTPTSTGNHRTNGTVTTRPSSQSSNSPSSVGNNRTNSSTNRSPVSTNRSNNSISRPSSSSNRSVGRSSGGSSIGRSGGGSRGGGGGGGRHR